MMFPDPLAAVAVVLVLCAVAALFAPFKPQPQLALLGIDLGGLGSVIGGAVGSIVPGVGTAVGGVLGGLLDGRSSSGGSASGGSSSAGTPYPYPYPYPQTGSGMGVGSVAGSLQDDGEIVDGVPNWALVAGAAALFVLPSFMGGRSRW